MAEVIFFIAAIGAVAGAVGTVALRNPFFCVLALVCHLLALALFVELTIALVGTSLSALDSDGAPYRTGFGTPAEVGQLFLTKFLVAFEIASLLLLIAAVGAVILARRRAGLAEPREISVADVMRRPAISAADAPPESMLEAGGPPQR